MIKIKIKHFQLSFTLVKRVTNDTLKLGVDELYNFMFSLVGT